MSVWKRKQTIFIAVYVRYGFDFEEYLFSTPYPKFSFLNCQHKLNINQKQDLGCQKEG